MRLLASFMTLALPLALTAVAPAFAHEDGTSHEDGNVFHDRSYGRHVDHEHGPNGEHIDHDYTGGRHVDHDYSYGRHVDHDYTGGRHVDHDYSYGGHIDHDYTNGRHVDRVYRYPDRDPYGYDGYDYDGRFDHTHRRYYDPDYGYYGRRYSRYDDDDDYSDRYRYDRRPYGGRYYGDYPPATRSYDPYYGGGGSFDWKQDWPFLVGTMFNAQIGR
jgi:hypothetical protein